MKLQELYRSPPKRSHLCWALPLGVLVCAAMWFFEVWVYDFGYYRANRSEIDSLYAGAVKNYIVSALIGSIPILVANWSRTLWPRLAVTLALVAVQLITGNIFVLAPRGA